LDFNARHFINEEWVRIVTQGPTIAEVGRWESQPVAADFDDERCVAPAFWDIQVNGRLGVSFSDPGLTIDQVAAIVRAQAALGTARLCPTLITAPRDALRHGLATIADACERFPDVGRRVLGIHLEGPFISPLEGYRGAHPVEAVRDPDWDEFQSLQEVSGGRIVLVTMAPERSGALAFIREAVEAGVVVALGHTAADPETIHEAIAAGARLSTHLGNGIAAQLPRHPNAIWTQAAADELWASLIADGFHLDRDTLRVLVRAKGHNRIILVSDASPLAGSPPGRYGDWEVLPSGKITVAGTPYLAGANEGMEVGLNGLIGAGMTILQAIVTATINPATLLNRPEPRLEPGAPANLVVFRRDTVRGRIEIEGACVDGDWAEGPPRPSRLRAGG
jgi:N-acetylglucosamine-6-phosphate deacetylase